MFDEYILGFYPKEYGPKCPSNGCRSMINNKNVSLERSS